MKSVALKSIALVTILAFAFMLVPQQAEANDCDNARAACLLARIIARWVCNESPPHCNLANEIADAICRWADDVCNP